MSSPIIALKDLKKTYRVYKHPFYQMLHLFSPSIPPQSSYTENHALQGIDLEIERGEKIGIIGRNGSGKSTLLKLIAGKIMATSGQIKVNGKVSELIELGTGFHPEFTGRQNVFSALANLGITGREAEEKYISIVDFSELEEHMHQPVRVYSTGMYMRLAFSVATCIRPELLLVDEVLSVGDAYFAQKSLEKMKELSAESNTTVLFVSHNIYSLSFLCDKLIWIHEGIIQSIGSPVSVLNRYDLSIREEEEKKKNSSDSSHRLANTNDKTARNRFGVGPVRINDVQILDASHNRAVYFRRGDKLTISMCYETDDITLCPSPVFLIGVTRHDSLPVTCALFKVDLREKGGLIYLDFPEILFNKGEYYITILVYRDFDISKNQDVFYTVDGRIMDGHTRCYEFKVDGSLPIESTMIRHPFSVRSEGAFSIEIFNKL